MLYQNLDLHAIAEIKPADGGVRPYRLPAAVIPALSEQGQRMAQNIVGAELRFVPLEDEVKITLSTAEAGTCNEALLYYGAVQSGWETLQIHIDDTPRTFTFRRSPRQGELEQVTAQNGFAFAPQVLRVLLSGAAIIIHDVKGAVRPPLPEELPAKKGVFYGSSITHGSLACTPNMFWTRRTAEALGADQENCGLAGSCRMEAAMADWFAARDDWDFMVLEMGVNVLDVYDADTYRTRVRYMLETLHAAHPEKRLFCIDLFYCNADLRGSAMPDTFRAILGEEIARIGSDRVVHVPGRSILDGTAGLSEDLVHPNIEGVNTIVRNLTAALRPYFA